MKLRILPQMLLFILLPAILGMAILSFSAKELATSGMTRQVDENLTNTVIIQAREIENITRLLQSVTVDMGRSNDLVSYLRAVAENDIGGAAYLKDQARGELAEVASNFTNIAEAGLTNLNGIVMVSTNSEVVGLDVKDRPYIVAALAGQQGASTITSQVDNASRVFFSTPVRDSDNKNVIVGVAFIMLDMKALAKSTVNAFKLGQTGICFVYDDKGVTIMHPNEKMIGDDNINNPWCWEILKNTGRPIAYTIQGTAKMAYSALVPNLGWRVVIAANEDDLLSSVTSMTNSLFLCTIVTLVVVGVLIFWMARGLAKVLQGGAAFTNYVAAGNLTLNADQKLQLDRDSERGDEIGDLAQGIGKLVTSLVQMVSEADERSHHAEDVTRQANEARAAAEAATLRAEGAKREGMLAAAAQLESSVNVIASASSELAAQISHSEHGSSVQAGRMAETATAMEEMNSTVLEVARNAAAAADVSNGTRSQAENGAKVVQQAVTRIREVQNQSTSLKSDMQRLNEQAQSISQIMGVISDIADQTNLLALNAAIEAARAGEAGRGFAVVADEVRKLAEKTMVSTTDVGKAIREIQDSAAKSMAQVDSSVAAIEEATDYANQSGAVLGEIVSMVDNTADQVRAIATAAEQQSASSDEINRFILEVNDIAAETASSMKEAAIAMEELSRQSQILNGLIDHMKS